jgi:hypothetical protein
MEDNYLGLYRDLFNGPPIVPLPRNGRGTDRRPLASNGGGEMQSRRNAGVLEGEVKGWFGWSLRGEVSSHKVSTLPHPAPSPGPSTVMTSAEQQQQGALPGF